MSKKATQNSNAQSSKNAAYPNPSVHDINLALWEYIKNVHPSFLKEYVEGDTKLTEINIMHGRMIMTKLFGPVGSYWGYELKGEIVKLGQAAAQLVELWYKPHRIFPDSFGEEMVCRVAEYGGAKIDVSDKHIFKKIITSGLSRCFMALGHGAIIYAGFYEADEDPNDVDKTTGLPLPQDDQKAAHSQQSEDKQPSELAAATDSQSEGCQSEYEDPREDFVSALTREYPYLSECEYKFRDGYVYFVKEVQTDKDRQKFIALNFAESRSKKGKLFTRMAIPENPHQFITNDMGVSDVQQ